MRIECPFCGERDVAEFTYLGDAGFHRPSPDGEAAVQRYYEAVYLRENPAGPHQELWYHAGGCLSWLRVTRDTRTHEILAVQLAAGTSPP
jgi:heterotetrameric sarcosine oxidase delta subunit